MLLTGRCFLDEDCFNCTEEEISFAEESSLTLSEELLEEDDDEDRFMAGALLLLRILLILPVFMLMAGLSSFDCYGTVYGERQRNVP